MKSSPSCSPERERVHDVVMVEERREARLTHEHVRAVPIAYAGEHALERDDAPCIPAPPLDGHLDGAHPTLSDEEKRPIAVEQLHAPKCRMVAP